ncbi:hypothetical protein [Streptomyces sp. NPDC006638]|uniref:hypothetical protein n=1 Tax=unclassified Streptomyces TaxID=2593676 RepID=UPI0033B4E86D
MGRSAPNTLLAALLVEARWSSGELARAVNALGTAHALELHYDRTSVAHWLSGSRPRPPVPDLVAAALTTRTGRLITAQDTGLVPLARDRDQPPQIWPGQGDPVARLAALSRGDTDPARRASLLKSAGSQAAYPLTTLNRLAWPDRPPVAAPWEGRSRHATTADVQRLRDMTQVFTDLTEHHGGAHARTALAAYLADDVSLLLKRSAPDRLRGDLLTAGAQLTHVLASMTADTGHLGLAQHYYRTALGLAHAGGNRSTYAITLRAMSTQALRLGHHRPALHLMDVAIQAAGPAAPPATLAFLHVQRALARAHDRQRRAALGDLNTAETQHGQSSGPPGPFTSYPRAGLDYQRAQTLLTLGHAADGLSTLRDSAAHRAPGRRRAFALTQAGLAETLLTLGHLEEACVHWHAFLDHYPHLKSVRTEQSLARLRARLRPYRRQRHAAAVWDRARLLTASPGGR